MKNIYLFLLLVSLSTSLNAQVFISNVTDDFLVGPNNYVGNPIIESAFSLAQIEDTKLRFDDLYSENSIVIESLKSKRRLKKKDKRKLRILATENLLIVDELLLIRKLELAWSEIWLPRKLFMETSKHPEKCFNVETSLGQYSIQELDVDPIFAKKDTSGQLVFDFVVVGKRDAWVKKKGDKDCLSADPNDCLVWCLEKVDSYVIFDMNQKEFDFQKCPDISYRIDKRNLKCRKYKNTLEKGEIERIDVRIKESGEFVVVFDWKAVDCK